MIAVNPIRTNFSGFGLVGATNAGAMGQLGGDGYPGYAGAIDCTRRRANSANGAASMSGAAKITTP